MPVRLSPDKVLTETNVSLATSGDIKYWVDPATGDDSNPGTEALPFASLVAPALLPLYHARIENKINIAVLNSISDPTKVPTTIDPVYVDGGSLALYGVGAPTRKAVNGGPHTVTAVADVAPNAQRVTVGGAAWTEDEFCGYHLRVVTGGHVGLTFPVYGNATGNVTVALGSPDKIHNGDTVEIIRPSVKIDFSHMHIALTDHSTASGPAGEYSRFVLANLWLDATPSLDWTQFRLAGSAACYPVMDFVRLDVLDFGCEFNNAVLGLGDAVDKSYVADCGADISNMGTYAYDANASVTSVGGRADAAVFSYGATNIYNLAVFGGMRSIEGSLFMCGACAYMDGSDIGAQGWFAGKDATTPAVDVWDNGRGDFKIHVEGPCNYAINAQECSSIYMHSSNSCSPTLTDKSAIRIGALAQVQIHDNCAGFLGATVGQEAYIFSSNSTKSATWPGATTLVTDTLGANLMRTT